MVLIDLLNQTVLPLVKIAGVKTFYSIRVLTQLSHATSTSANKLFT